MIRNVTSVWKKTVDAHWGDANNTCVEGSVGDKSSLSGGVFDSIPSSDGSSTPTSEVANPSESKKSAAQRLQATGVLTFLMLSSVAMAALI